MHLNPGVSYMLRNQQQGQGKRVPRGEGSKREELAVGTAWGQKDLLMQNGRAAGLSRGRVKTSENPLGFHFL